MAENQEIESLESILSKLETKDLGNVTKILYGSGCR